MHIGISAQLCTIMSSVKIGVVLLVCTMTQCSTRCKKQYCWHKVLLHSWRHLNSHYMWQQGAVCWWWCLWGSRWSRWCASDEYQVSGRQFWLKQMCWYGWQNPTGFQWYQKLPSNPLSVCLKNPCVHVLFYFLLITDKKRLLNHSTLEKWKANRANEGLNPSKPILMKTEHCLSSICSPT